MSYNAIIWLIFDLLSILALAFYSMLEMACVSFNKVRLQYYVSKGSRRILWINYLLQHPARLFGTTLIGVNIALVIGSECSREFYSALGLSPDIAPLTQVVLVVIFGELAPMFAARRYPEHVATLGIPLIYASAKLMTPFLIVIDWISRAAIWCLGGRNDEANIYLTKEELLKILEEQSDEASSENEELNSITANIFSLRDKHIRQVMDPITPSMALPSTATINDMEWLLNKSDIEFVPIYHKELSNIIGLVYPRDILKASGMKRIRDFALTPWFVSETTGVIQVLKQFRTNNEAAAVILNYEGKAVGIVTLDDVLEEIFGNKAGGGQKDTKQQKNLMLIEKTFPAEMTVKEFKEQYGVLIDPNQELSLANVLSNHLGHHAEKGESVFLEPFEFTVKETTLTDIKTVSVSTKI